MDKKVFKFLSDAGKKGGSSKSEKKVLSGRENIKKAMAKRWPVKQDGK